MRYLRLGSSGMHGLAGTALTVNGVLRYASSLGTWLGESPKVGIAIDSRYSSPMFRSACLAGLLSAGADVLDCGICPAPVLHHCVRKYSLDGALLVGAGHHPAGWNTIVPISSNASWLTPTQSQEMLDIYHSGIYRQATWDRIGKTECADTAELTESYMHMLCGFIHAPAIREAKFKILCDFCNGSGGIAGKAFAEHFGIELIAINDAVSGVLPHDPEPRPRSSVQLASLMPYLKADAGFVFSSDVSRVAVVTDTGETLSEEYTYPLAAKHVLENSTEGSAVVTNYCTTRTLDDIVASCGGKLYKGSVGQAWTIDKMFETSAILAGDGSGSAAFAKGIPAFDGFAVMATILETMALRRKTSSQLAAELPRYHIIKTSMPCPSSHAYNLIRSIRGKFPDAKLSEEDGLRFDWPDGWVHLRASRTEPVIRLIAEWKDRETAERKVIEFRSLIERIFSAP